MYIFHNGEKYDDDIKIKYKINDWLKGKVKENSVSNENENENK